MKNEFYMESLKDFLDELNMKGVMASSEGSMKNVGGGGAAAASDSSLTYAVAVMVPKDFKLIKQEWAAIRIQAVFRAFLVTLVL